MKYRQINWKYQLAETVTFQTRIYPERTLRTDWITLHPNGSLILEADYCWDGPSGPAFDTQNFMRGSAVHDALFQLMKLGLLSTEWFKESNRELIRWCKRDGMWAIRRRWVYWAVQRYGRDYLTYDADDHKVYIVPRGSADA